MAANTTFIPEIPLGPADVWEFDGEFSVQVNHQAEIRQRAVERTGIKISDAAFLNAPDLTITGVMTATPHRFTLTNPTGPFVGPTRLASEYKRIVALFSRLGVGVVNSPDFDFFYNYMISAVSPSKNTPERKHEYTITFTHISLVTLGIVPINMSVEAQGLGYGGFVDKGAL